MLDLWWHWASIWLRESFQINPYKRLDLYIKAMQRKCTQMQTVVDVLAHQLLLTTDRAQRAHASVVVTQGKDVGLKKNAEYEEALLTRQISQLSVMENETLKLKRRIEQFQKKRKTLHRLYTLYIYLHQQGVDLEFFETTNMCPDDFFLDTMFLSKYWPEESKHLDYLCMETLRVTHLSKSISIRLPAHPPNFYV